MATKSILKDVSIKDPSLAHTFVNALENAKNSKVNQPRSAVSVLS